MLTATRIEVWTTTCNDQPGGLSDKLERLAMHGADLEFLFARRREREPGKGLIFLAPVTSEDQRAAARQSGYEPARDLHVVRVEGANEPGLGYRLAHALAEEHINMRSISAMAMRNEFTAYLALDSAEDAQRVVDHVCERV